MVSKTVFGASTVLSQFGIDWRYTGSVGIVMKGVPSYRSKA